VQTEVHNYSDQAITTEVEQQVIEWKSHAVRSNQADTKVESTSGRK
jgi:hypothetical protein